jgi:DNA-binding NtrC family response regulator
MPQYQDPSLNVAHMPAGLSALLVHDRDEPVAGVERILLAHGVRLRRSRNCFEARAVLRDPAASSVIVTDLTLPDGDWTDILRAANAAPAKTPVIVVARVLDIRLYLDVLDSGAHDFVVPPFSAADLAHIVSSALSRDRPLASSIRRRHEPVDRPCICPAERAASVQSTYSMSAHNERVK